MYHDQFPVINIASSPKHEPFSRFTVSPAAGCRLPPRQVTNLNSCSTVIASSCNPSTLPQTPAMDQSPNKKRVAISNLMSPPELKTHDNFSHVDEAATASTTSLHAEGKGKGKAKPMISPPESPGIASFSYPGTTAVATRDPILYPSSQAFTASTAPPLFTQAKHDQLHENVDTRVEEAVEKHMRHSPGYLFEVRPAKEDYELAAAVCLVSKLGQCFNADQRRWCRQQRELLKSDNQARANRRDREKQELRASLAARLSKHPTPIQPRAPPPVNDEIRVSDKALKPHRPSRVTKPAGADPKPRRPSNEAPPKSASSPRSIPDASPSADGKDRHFSSFPDYSPPLNTLPDKPSYYKVEWKGPPSDLTDDPYRHLLHPREIPLAETLKLDGALYLAAKRRFFIRRLECARIKKPFRKTDAQQACRIDVNKASRLWTVYDRVGWLDERWVKPYM